MFRKPEDELDELDNQQLKERLQSSLANVSQPPVESPQLPSEDAIYGGGLSDAAIQSAQDTDRQIRLTGTLVDAASKIGAGIAGLGSANVVKADVGAADALAKQATLASDLETRRKLKDYGLERQSKVFDAQQKRDRLDPKSERSKRAVDMAAQRFPEYKNAFKDKSEEEIDAYLKLFQQKEEMTLNREKILSERLARLDARSAKEQAAKEKKDQDYIDKNLPKLSKDIAGAQALTSAFETFESALGGKVQDFKIKDDELYKDGKKIDLPGVSTPLLGGRTTFYSSKARKLQSSFEPIFNITLKDRSGAAVTTPEMERLKAEFARGAFSTEAEMIDAAKRYKIQVHEVLKNREAAYRPELVEKYAEQGAVSHSKAPLFEGLSRDETPNKAQDPKIKQFAEQHGLDYSKAEDLLRKRGYGN